MQLLRASPRSDSVEQGGLLGNSFIGLLTKYQALRGYKIGSDFLPLRKRYCTETGLTTTWGTQSSDTGDQGRETPRGTEFCLCLFSDKHRVQPGGLNRASVTSNIVRWTKYPLGMQTGEWSKTEEHGILIILDSQKQKVLHFHLQNFYSFKGQSYLHLTCNWPSDVKGYGFALIWQHMVSILQVTAKRTVSNHLFHFLLLPKPTWSPPERLSRSCFSKTHRQRPCPPFQTGSFSNTC